MISEISNNKRNSEVFSYDSDEASDEPKSDLFEKSTEEILDQSISVPPLAPEERIVSAVACNGGISYTTVAPSELVSVPEEDEEATSSTPSTVVWLVEYM